MDRVSSIAQRALERLGSSIPPAGARGALPREMRIGSVGMSQLARLVYLQAGDPLVDQVLAMLKAGRPVYMDRPALEASLDLAHYPPRLREQFNRWFSRLAGYGIALTGKSPIPAPPDAAPVPRAEPPKAQKPAAAQVAATVITRPEQEIFAEILGEALPEPHPCVKEPGRACCGSGRCKTLGF